MNDPSNPTERRRTLEEGVSDCFCNARECIREQHQKCENLVRQSPTTAVLGAVAAGYLLHRLPLRAIIATKIRVLTALTPPALFLFGAAKIFECLQRQEPENRE